MRIFAHTLAAKFRNVQAVLIAGCARKTAAAGQFIMCEDGVVVEHRDTTVPRGAMFLAIRYNDPFQPTYIS